MKVKEREAQLDDMQKMLVAVSPTFPLFLSIMVVPQHIVKAGMLLPELEKLSS